MPRVSAIPTKLVGQIPTNKITISTPWATTGVAGDTLKFAIDLSGPALGSGQTVSFVITASGTATAANFDYSLAAILAQLAALDPTATWNAGTNTLTLTQSSKRHWAIMPRVREGVIADGTNITVTLTLSSVTGATITNAASTVTVSGSATPIKFFSIDASVATNLVASGGSGHPSSGGAVQSISDSVTGGVFSQTSGGNQPTWTGSLQNSLGGLTFTASGSIYTYLATSNATLLGMLNAAKQPYTFFIVGSSAGIETSYAPQTALQWTGSNSGTAVTYWEFRQTTNMQYVGFDDCDTTQNYTTPTVQSSVTDTTNHWYVWCCVSDGTTRSLYQDGVLVAQDSNVTKNGAHTATGLTIGANADSWYGAIGQIDGYNVALSGNDLHSAMATLATKWGTTAPPAYVAPQYDIAAATYSLIFQDDFNSPNWADGNSGTWRPCFVDKPGPDGTALPNQEYEWNFNPGYLPTQPINPFAFGTGGMTLSTTAIPSWASSVINAEGVSYYNPTTFYTYASGHMNTLPWTGGGNDGLGFQYGYVSVLFKYKAVVGTWPAALWMLPYSRDSTTEIDLMEAGGTSAVLSICNQTFHTQVTGLSGTISATGASQVLDYDGNTSWTNQSGVANMSTAWNVAELEWTPTLCTFYVNRIPQWSLATPTDYHQPFHLLINQAVSDLASFIPVPDGTTAANLPMQLYIRNVKVYQKAPAAVTVYTGTQAESTALYAAMPTTPGTAHKVYINNMIIALKGYTLTEDPSYNLFNCWDCLYFISPDAQANALINWVNPGTYTATLQGTGITAAAGLGWTGGNGTNCISTGLNLSTATGLKSTLTLQSMVYGCSGTVTYPYGELWCSDGALGNAEPDGSGTIGMRWQAQPDGSTVLKVNENESNTSVPGASNPGGILGITRYNRALNFYKNGRLDAPGLVCDPSIDLSSFANGTISFAGRTNTYNYLFGLGRPLHAQDWKNFYTAVYPYLHYCGAI